MQIWIVIAIMFFTPFFLKAEKLKVEGEIDIITKIGSKPTSERGQVAFSIPSFKLSADYLIEENKSVYFQLQMAENRNKDTKKQQVELSQAYYEFISDDESWIIRYGLVRSAYLNDNDWVLDYDLVSDFRPLAYRYNYLPSSDLGLETRYLFSTYFDVSLGVFNGEENTGKEDGAQKDVYIGLNYDDSDFHVALLTIRGAYDEYEKPFNDKERNLARLVWKGSLFHLGFEGMTSKELSNATVAYKRAENWDGSLIPEVVVQGEALSGWILFKADEELEILFRKDYLDPYKEVKLNEIESENIALILKSGLRSILIGYTKTFYKELHSSQAQEREYSLIGLRQIF